MIGLILSLSFAVTNSVITEYGFKISEAGVSDSDAYQELSLQYAGIYYQCYVKPEIKSTKNPPNVVEYICGGINNIEGVDCTGDDWFYVENTDTRTNKQIDAVKYEYAVVELSNGDRLQWNTPSMVRDNEREYTCLDDVECPETGANPATGGSMHAIHQLGTHSDITVPEESRPDFVTMPDTSSCDISDSSIESAITTECGNAFNCDIIESFGFEIDSSATSESTSLIKISLLWYGQYYECFVRPDVKNTGYSCLGITSLVGAGCGSSNWIYVENTDLRPDTSFDSVRFSEVFVNDGFRFEKDTPSTYPNGQSKQYTCLDVADCSESVDAFVDLDTTGGDAVYSPAPKPDPGCTETSAADIKAFICDNSSC